jgi:hypothetical protein
MEKAAEALNDTEFRLKLAALVKLEPPEQEGVMAALYVQVMLEAAGTVTATGEPDEPGQDKEMARPLDRVS